MISFHAALFPDRRPKMTIPDSSRKRKWGEVVVEGEGEGGGEERSRAREFLDKKRPGWGNPGSSALEVELHLEEPFAVERQRRMDVQSGEVRFYEVRTDKRTCKESELISASDRLSTTSTVGRTISLNLELNLQPYDEYLSPQEVEKTTSTTRRSLKEAKQRIDEGGGGGEEDVEAEMVATVCGRCHMLVMLCVSRPRCPNCKFLHPAKPDQTPFTLLPKPHPQLHPPKCTTTTTATTTAQLLC